MNWKTELEVVRQKSKEERIKYFYEFIKIKESKRPTVSELYEYLNITDDETGEYRDRLYRNASMKPKEKRDIVIKEIYKPLLKEAGFKTSRNDWWKELDDGYLLIHIQNSQYSLYNACFRMNICAAGKEDIIDEIKNQWMYCQMKDLNQFHFLPHGGLTSPYCSGDMYEIDGLKAYLPLDTPIDVIRKDFREDFEVWILPELKKIHSMKDWEKLYQEKQEQRNDKMELLIRYYLCSILACCAESNRKGLEDDQKRFGLTKEEIIAHFDLLEELTQRSAFPFHEPEPYILKSLE